MNLKVKQILKSNDDGMSVMTWQKKVDLTAHLFSDERKPIGSKAWRRKQDKAKSKYKIKLRKSCLPH